MATIASAKKIYSAKVCKGYLGIPEAGCSKAFDLLIENMKREALAPAPLSPASEAKGETKKA